MAKREVCHRRRECAKARVMSMRLIRFGWQSVSLWLRYRLRRGMRDYFIRRFLLLIPTLLVITMITFGVTRIAPGGPMEQAMMEAQMVSMEGGGGRSEGRASEEQLNK